MTAYTIHINNKNVSVDVAADTPMLWVLRDTLGMVGTKYGCGAGACGACTVHLNGTAVRSCQLPVSAVGEARITTIEGLSGPGEKLHPVQEAWLEHDVAQCGYCQPGQMMTAAALLAQNADPDDKTIDQYMSGNICRCGTYTRIRKAIKTAASKV